MAGDEYSVGGGKLKLKGSKVSGGRVEKKKKKSSKKDKTAENTELATKPSKETGLEKRSEKEGGDSEEERERNTPGKTDAEKKYEEIRRKRVCVSLP